MMTAEKQLARRPPTSPDRSGFSGGAIRKAALSGSLNHSLTLFPAAMGLLGVFSMALLGPTSVLLLATIGAFTAGIGNGIINYFFRWDKHANAHLEGLAKKMADYREWSKTEIKRVLMECESMGGVGKYAARGREQYDEINGKFDLLREILAKKLNPRELTHARYLGSAEQVYLNTLENLRDLVNYIKGIAAMGGAYRKDLERLQVLEHPTEAERTRLATLMERDELKRSQQEKVAELLAINERALTKIDKTIAVFTRTRTRGSEADVDIETAIAELETLAARVHKYSISK